VDFVRNAKARNPGPKVGFVIRTSGTWQSGQQLEATTSPGRSQSSCPGARASPRRAPGRRRQTAPGQGPQSPARKGKHKPLAVTTFILPSRIVYTTFQLI